MSVELIPRILALAVCFVSMALLASLVLSIWQGWRWLTWLTISLDQYHSVIKGLALFAVVYALWCFGRLTENVAHFGKEGSPQPILVDISQETLAEMIGTTRSRVSFFMNKFRKLGLISYNGKIEVHNSLLNAVLHEKPPDRTG
jgi:Crp-like helix-turn-helix domain